MDSLTTEQKEIVYKLFDNIQVIEEFSNKIDADEELQELKKLKVEKMKYDLSQLYIVNSLLFAYLQMNGVDAKKHAVVGELQRVTAKVKSVQDMNIKENPTMTVNKDACSRIMKHSLWESAQEKQKPKQKTPKPDQTEQKVKGSKLKNTDKKKNIKKKKGNNKK